MAYSSMLGVRGAGKRTMNQVFRLSVVLIAAIAILSCGRLGRVDDLGVLISPIGEVEQQKGTETQQSPIYLQGKVVQQAPFLQGGAYQLRDETGQIWVVTQGTLPAIGEEIVIQGKPSYQSIPLGGQELGEVYIQELQQGL